ncbi:MAG TPA: hypothetical protein G4O11_03130 [Anaerolineae bacterium]|nr:hypothetical protein [Anaerolineae bacterium]
MEVKNHPVKLLLIYDPVPGRREAYLQYVQGKLIPALEYMGLTMCEAWHTAYGAYPLRMAGFLAPDRDTLTRILASDIFQDLETRLQDYVVNYERKIVSLRPTFQF